MGKGGGHEPKSKLLSQEDTGLFSFGGRGGILFSFLFFSLKEPAAAQSEEAHGSFFPK